jgi:hypothetical protein
MFNYEKLAALALVKVKKRGGVRGIEKVVEVPTAHSPKLDSQNSPTVLITKS